MILGFDFLGFQAIKRFPTKNRIFLHVIQSTTTKNSFLLVFYSYVLVFYPYVTQHKLLIWIYYISKFLKASKFTHDKFTTSLRTK